MQGEGEITLLNVKTAVVFTLSWAGVTPAPSERKMRDVVPVRTLLGTFTVAGDVVASNSLG